MGAWESTWPDTEAEAGGCSVAPAGPTQKEGLCSECSRKALNGEEHDLIHFALDPLGGDDLVKGQTHQNKIHSPLSSAATICVVLSPCCTFGTLGLP